MKKLMTMFVAVAAACVAQAAAVQWNAGNIYMSDGTTKPVKDQVTAIFWESTSDVFSSYSAADLYAAKDSPSSISGYVKSANSNALGGGLNMTSGTSFAPGTDVYSAILYINNEEGGYMASFGHTTASTAKITIADMGVYNGGSYGGTHGAAIDNSNWGSAIPEPSSGLLLLVGAGMLALRRKRK